MEKPEKKLRKQRIKYWFFVAVLPLATIRLINVLSTGVSDISRLGLEFDKKLSPFSYWTDMIVLLLIVFVSLVYVIFGYPKKADK